MMKLISTLIRYTKQNILIVILFVMTGTVSKSQISLVCTDPTHYIYGLTGDGEIYPINIGTAKVGTVVKNGTYSGKSPSQANGLGYNSFNSKFYYFKRNVTAAPQQFVSFTPLTNTVSILASSTCTDDIHTGCVSFNGAGYYTIDVQGTLHYYNIASNSWTFITSKIVDQNGNNVTNIIKTQSAGDMAVDGLGNIWFLTSSNSNYGLYKIPSPMPTTPIVQLNVVRVINPTASTPTGNSFAGIAFSPSGQIYMSTRGDDKLYVMQTSGTLTFIGNLNYSDIGNDLTSCSFPIGVLPVVWKDFNVTVQNRNIITLAWDVFEYDNRGFYVEESATGNEWNELAFIPGKNDPSSVQHYSWSQTNSQDGKQYYRIKQVDMDDRENYSEIKTIRLQNGQQGITIWPNPAADMVRFSGGNNNFTKAQVFDPAGRMLVETKLESHSNSLMLNRIPPGVYVIRVECSNGAIFNQKIIKQ